MSAWIVDKAHIDLLITAGLVLSRPHGPLRWNESSDENVWKSRELRQENAADIGRMLWLENYASVDRLYGDEDELPGPVGLTFDKVGKYVFRPINGTLDPVVVLKAIDCYEYQSCEHPGWKTSEARRFCQSLQSTCIGRLKGYDDAPWGFEDRNYFTKLQAASDVAAAQALTVLDERRREKKN